MECKAVIVALLQPFGKAARLWGQLQQIPLSSAGYHRGVCGGLQLLTTPAMTGQLPSLAPEQGDCAVPLGNTRTCFVTPA